MLIWAPHSISTDPSRIPCVLAHDGANLTSNGISDWPKMSKTVKVKNGGRIASRDSAVNRSSEQVAGVYFTEHRVDCVIGYLDDGSHLDLSPTQAPAPKTINSETRPRLHCSINRNQRSPSELIEEVVGWLAKNTKYLTHLAVACFGPFESLTDREDAPSERGKYGRLGELPQYPTKWQRLPLYYLFVKSLRASGLQAVVRVYTDVDASAYGEYWYRAGKLGKNKAPTSEGARYLNQESIVFLKFSRTISAGITHRNEIWQGRLHPVAGAFLPRIYRTQIGGVPYRDPFPGSCKFHGNCIEGLIGQQALEDRTKLDFLDIPRIDDRLWLMVAYYIAQLCIAISSFVAPSRIFIGGRTVGENIDLEAATRLTRYVRGYFYNHVVREVADTTGPLFSPDYPEIRDVDRFISLPSRPTLKGSGQTRMAMPGRHGALKLAAKKAMEARVK